MNTSRRDLLKYFAAGTIISPLAGAGVTARLIEPPKAVLIYGPKEIISPEPLDFSQVRAFTVTCEMQDGTRRTLASRRMITPCSKSGAIVKPGDLILDLGIAEAFGRNGPPSVHQAFMAARVDLL